MTSYGERILEAMVDAVLVPLATISPDGYPCVVPVRFYPDLHFEAYGQRHRSALVIPMDRDSQIVRYIEHNGKGSISLQDAKDRQRIYVLQGDIEIQEDLEQTLLGEIIGHYDNPGAAAWLEAWRTRDYVLLRLVLGRTLRLQTPDWDAASESG